MTMNSFTSFFAALLIAAVLVLAPASASAHVVPSPCDFTTGGGFVFRDTGEMVNFGLVGGCKNGGFFGHVNIVDRGFPGHLHVSSTSIDGYFDPIDPGQGYRDICGTARTNLFGTVKFRVRT